MAECFVIYSEKIEGRFDPLYLKNISSIKDVKTKYPLVPIGQLLRENVQYGANEIAIDGDPKKDVRYIRITDIDEFGNLKDDVWQTAKYVDDKYLLEEDDILFARSGATAGKTFIFKNEFGRAIFAGYLIRFKIDKTKANPKYVFFYTQLSRYNLWVKSIQRPSGQPNINSEEFKSFEIPFPPLEIQNKFVKLMGSTYLSKKSKEAEAQQLLDSLNDYVLDELGIKLPESQDRTCYSVYSEETQDKRFDAYYYQPKFEEIEKAIKKGKYKSVVIKDVFDNQKLIKGILPNAEEKEGEVKVLQIRNILRNGLIIINEYVTAKNIFKPEHQIKEDEIIVVITGATIGKVGLWNSGELFYLGGDMVKFKTNSQFNPYYVQSFLLSELGQYQVTREITGATNKHLSPADFETLMIPCPPISVQNKIAEEVKKRIQKVEQLHQEAKELVEKAKAEVENILLK